jgi:RNA-dependent RNA polymerase
MTGMAGKVCLGVSLFFSASSLICPYKVQQVARVVTKLAFDGDGTAPSYSLRLEKQAMGRSHRISRFYGSRRVIQVTIPKTIFNSFNNGLYGYFINNAFVIFGRVFRAVFAKDRHVYLVETNEDYKRKALDNPIDQDRLSLHEFINWHNDICHNLHQVLTKNSCL